MENSELDQKKVPEASHRFIAIGSQVHTLLEDAQLLGNSAEVVYSANDLNSWDTDTNTQQCDLVVIECNTVFPETVQLIKEKTRSSGASMAVVIYQFTQESARGMMARASLITPLRAPIESNDLKYVCEADLAMASIRNSPIDVLQYDEEEDLSEEEAKTLIPDRLYSDEILTKIAKISTSIDCECPHHMANLLKSLNAFEEYCKMCESRNEEDLVLHSLLHRKTAHARSIMESALTVLADVENFDLTQFNINF